MASGPGFRLASASRMSSIASWSLQAMVIVCNGPISACLGPAAYEAGVYLHPSDVKQIRANATQVSSDIRRYTHLTIFTTTCLGPDFGLVVVLTYRGQPRRGVT